jgi:hypothetical protein
VFYGVTRRNAKRPPRPAVKGAPADSQGLMRLGLSRGRCSTRRSTQQRRSPIRVIWLQFSRQNRPPRRIWLTSTPPANHRPRRADSCRFDTYFKVQCYDTRSLTWRDIQKQHPTPEDAIAAFPAGERCRVMEVTEKGRGRFDMKTHLIIAATLLLAGSRVHYSIRGSGRDITVQAE